MRTTRVSVVYPNNTFAETTAKDVSTLKEWIAQSSQQDALEIENWTLDNIELFNQQPGSDSEAKPLNDSDALTSDALYYLRKKVAATPRPPESPSTDRAAPPPYQSPAPSTRSTVSSSNDDQQKGSNRKSGEETDFKKGEKKLDASVKNFIRLNLINGLYNKKKEHKGEEIGGTVSSSSGPEPENKMTAVDRNNRDWIEGVLSRPNQYASFVFDGLLLLSFYYNHYKSLNTQASLDKRSLLVFNLTRLRMPLDWFLKENDSFIPFSKSSENGQDEGLDSKSYNVREHPTEHLIRLKAHVSDLKKSTDPLSTHVRYNREFANAFYDFEDTLRRQNLLGGQAQAVSDTPAHTTAAVVIFNTISDLIFKDHRDENKVNSIDYARYPVLIELMQRMAIALDKPFDKENNEKLQNLVSQVESWHRKLAYALVAFCILSIAALLVLHFAYPAVLTWNPIDLGPNYSPFHPIVGLLSAVIATSFTSALFLFQAIERKEGNFANITNSLGSTLWGQVQNYNLEVEKARPKNFLGF